MDTMMLPSALMFTIATEAVGDGLHAERETATSAQHAIAPVEGCAPAHPLGNGFEHLRDRGIANDGAGCLRSALANDVPAAKFAGIDPQFARHDVGVTLVGPHELRNAEAAHRA